MSEQHPLLAALLHAQVTEREYERLRWEAHVAFHESTAVEHDRLVGIADVAWSASVHARKAFRDTIEVHGSITYGAFTYTYDHRLGDYRVTENEPALSFSERLLVATGIE